MSENSHIEWTDATWNPVTGCTKVSGGCLNCYIDRTPPFRMTGRRFDKPGIGGSTGVVIHEERLEAPLHWRKPRRIFVNSLSDLFHARVPREFVARVFAVMAATPQHTYQVLSKRPERMARMLSDQAFRHEVAQAIDALYDDPDDQLIGDGWPLRHVWLGTSIESDDYACRADALRATPAVVRFISAEPLLGPLSSLDLTGIDWLIAGGESGPGARPMHPDWVRDLRDRCAAAGTAFFFKQHGAWRPGGDVAQPARWVGQDGRFTWPQAPGSAAMVKVGKHAAGRVLDGRTWDQYPNPNLIGADR